MMQPARISATLLDQLAAVAPSTDGVIEYRPCSATTTGGTVHERVYFVEADEYIRVWGVWPNEDPHKTELQIARVTGLRESPHRLPAELANKMYAAGESGMGYCIFTLVLADGRRLPYAVGNAVDFPNLPAGVTMDMVVDLLPHEGREAFAQRGARPTKTGAPYEWCVFRR